MIAMLTCWSIQVGFCLILAHLLMKIFLLLSATYGWAETDGQGHRSRQQNPEDINLQEKVLYAGYPRSATKAEIFPAECRDMLELSATGSYCSSLPFSLPGVFYPGPKGRSQEVRSIFSFLYFLK